MKRYIFQISGILLVISIVVGLAYVSLLGENDKATKIVLMYIDNIAKKKYDANVQYCTQSYLNTFDAVNDPVTHQFSLETALLKHFGLTDTIKYTVDTARNTFWMPYSGKDNVAISVRINSEDKAGSFKKIFSPEKKEYIKDLFSLIREDGQWKIDKINLNSAGLARDYQNTKNTMSSSKYVVRNNDKVTIMENSLELKNLTSVEKRIITFNLNKILNLLNSSE